MEGTRIAEGAEVEVTGRERHMVGGERTMS
jgi:hypothetical protein